MIDSPMAWIGPALWWIYDAIGAALMYGGFAALLAIAGIAGWRGAVRLSERMDDA